MPLCHFSSLPVCDPIHASVLLFYRPPTDDDPSSVLKVLLLPGTVQLSKVLKEWRSIHGEDIYIETPACELIPNLEYTLSTSPRDDSIIILPNSAKFDESSYHNYMPTFEVILKGRCTEVTLFLSNTSGCALKRFVPLSAPALRTLNVSAEERLFSVRRSFIKSISLSNLKDVVDRLSKRGVFTYAEWDEANEMQEKNDMARFVIDTVMHKGPDACSAMILILWEYDPFLCEHLELASPLVPHLTRNGKKTEVEESDIPSSSKDTTQERITSNRTASADINLVSPMLSSASVSQHSFQHSSVLPNMSRPHPIPVHVLLFYKPPIDDNDPRSVLKVLLLSGNFELHKVQSIRWNINGEEIYIETPPCKLIPNQEYTLSTSPENDSIIIQPKKRTFVDESSDPNYLSTFDIILKKRFKQVGLFLRDSNTSDCAWDANVDLSNPDLRRQFHPTGLPPSLRASRASESFQEDIWLRLDERFPYTFSLDEERLLSVRSSFINGVSHPILNSVVDRLSKIRVLTNAEQEEANRIQVKTDKARFVIDTVRYKGPDASSTLILILWEIDPFLCEHLKLASPIVPHLTRKRAEVEESDIPSSSKDTPRETMTPNRPPSVDIVPPMLSSSSTSQQFVQHSPKEMSCDTACDVSTTDHPVTESLSSPHPSLELQHETDLSRCFSGLRIQESSSLPRSHSLPSLSQIPYIENMASFRAKRYHSLNDVTLLDKTQRMTPDIIVVENQESYRFHSTQAGLFQCSVTGLVFKMKAEEDVTYRTVPWYQSVLAQQCKRPAGPLFDIKCTQGPVCQVHFPHCEILSTGGGKSLSVLHVMEEGIDLIKPDVITESHVIINVTQFSPYGVVNEDNCHNPSTSGFFADARKWATSFFVPKVCNVLVVMFYTPPIDDNLSSIVNILLLPGNVVLKEVLDERRKIHGAEIYIESPPCELMPNQEYTLSISPQKDSIIILPKKAKVSSYGNYHATFIINLLEKFEHVSLFLKDSNTSDCAWEGFVNLADSVLRKQQVQRTLSLPEEERLFSVRSSFISSVSDPVLNLLLDKLLQKGVLNDAELEMANGMQVKTDKARFVIDTVRRKGTPASSSMILFLSKTDPFLSDYLRLT